MPPPPRPRRTPELRDVVAAGAIATAVLVALVGCSPDAPSTSSAPVGTGTRGDTVATSAAAAYPRLTPACPTASPGAAPPTVTVAELNRVVAGLDLPLWQAGDIGASTRLPDGRIVWVFGDTVRDDAVSPRVVANSMLVTSGLCTSQVETLDRGPVIPDRAGGSVHWPMSVATLVRGDQTLLVVISARIRRGTSGALDFTYLGSSATVFDATGAGAPRLRSQLDITPDSPKADQVNWGSAMTVQDPWIYVYGTRLPSATSFGRSLYVARAPAADARDRGTWEFWDGWQWSPQQQDAAPVLGAEGVACGPSSKTRRASCAMHRWPIPASGWPTASCSSRSRATPRTSPGCCQSQPWAGLSSPRSTSPDQDPGFATTVPVRRPRSARCRPGFGRGVRKRRPAPPQA